MTVNGLYYIGYLRLLTESCIHFSKDHFARGRANAGVFARDRRIDKIKINTLMGPVASDSCGHL